MSAQGVRPEPPVFAELATTTNFSFLRGASHPEELVARAMQLGYPALGITDRNSLAGVVRAHVAARETANPTDEQIGPDAPLRIIVGARLVFCDGTPDIFVWPEDRAAYGRLCRLLTTGNRRAEKGDCHLHLADLLDWGEGLVMAVAPPSGHLAGFDRLAGIEDTLRVLVEAFPGAVYLAARVAYHGDDRARLALLAGLAERCGTPLLATNETLYHTPERRPLQDVVTCIREHVTLQKAGLLLAQNAERHLKSPSEMARLFRAYPQALRVIQDITSRINFSLDQLSYIYPDEPTGMSRTPQEELTRLTNEGAIGRYPDGVPAEIRKRIDHEIALIGKLDYAPYFLTVCDIVRFARARGILCQGRGSAANSTVCFCLGITEVDPQRMDLLFERFISEERREPPDIDVDFEHERREEVIQYIYEKYGRERAGLAATVISYRARSAIREVGKVFGLSEDATGGLAGAIWGWSEKSITPDEVRRRGLDPDDPTLARMLALTREIIGFPRHLSQHVGGFVITRDRLDETVPIQNAAMEDRTVVEWDKDDLDALGMLKIDVLGLGMLTCIRKAFDLLRDRYGRNLTLASIPSDDASVYRMLQRADSLGVFQVESRAQMTMLPRLKPKDFYDLVIEVAIVRPGPIQGDMVHPYLRRRQGLETVVYPSPAPGKGDKDELEQVLGKTLGVPLFQEQAMKIAIVAAGFTPSEADRLRRAMATFRRVGTIGTFQAKMINGMSARGYDPDFAARCFKQIEGFGDYGFPESHAASFALLVYASSWLKCHYPDVFAAALLNSQPMGFYAPAQIVRDAAEHGIEARPVDVNLSDWDNTLEREFWSAGGNRFPPASHMSGSMTCARHPLAAPPSKSRQRRLLRYRLRRSRSRCHLPTRGFGPRASGIDRAKVPPPRPSPTRGEGAIAAWHVENSIRFSRRKASKSPGTAPALPPPLWGRVGVGGEARSAQADEMRTHFECRTRSAQSRAQGNRLDRLDAGQSDTGPATRLHPLHAEMRDDVWSDHAIRLGFRQIKGIGEEEAGLILARRGQGYDSLRDLWLRTGLPAATIERLADADAFRSIGLDRRAALWAARGLDTGSPAETLPLFAAAADGDLRREPDVDLPPMPLGEQVVNDYRFLKLSLKAHPVSFLRADLDARKVTRNATLRELRPGRRVTVAGLVLVRQRPGSASGVIFMTLEDETAVANIIVWPKVFERFRPQVIGARLIAATGRLQNEQSVIHVVAETITDLTPMLATLSDDADDLEALARCDEVRRPIPDMAEKLSRRSRPGHVLKEAPDPGGDLDGDLERLAKATHKAMPKGRNFH